MCCRKTSLQTETATAHRTEDVIEDHADGGSAASGVRIGHPGWMSSMISTVVAGSGGRGSVG